MHQASPISLKTGMAKLAMNTKSGQAVRCTSTSSMTPPRMV